MPGTLDDLPESDRKIVVNAVQRIDPALAAAVVDHEPTRSERQAVMRILAQEFTRHLDERYEPTEYGRMVDAALGHFLLRWPIDRQE